ncbi:Kynureninase [Thiomonas arsenitoxydans]|uniref:Kynureninase n=1 Tax=Thiomonas arsenitoxydans (strain DSM 22701 / CIP 110005 / 3As) TaxID=426114 RepID=D6CPL9_THIA3|nr:MULTISPECIES: kynureninase [Thiomonas]CAZ87949.1 Kynureninase [Thiomonas arsenitoxydans]CDW94884.1 Kynureninase [Thiomonas sp. CB2]CQR26519.1 Kynureninase [Thiomonas arsenitoxydans]CQR27220.1 Kynureninase [Thiomonas arsenitoxydans]CQR31497.1 Kynureninase [Thiomonas arsenitoxydans]
MPTLQRQDGLALDAADPLAPLREQFTLPDGVIYLDGNSLGALPRATAARVQTVLTEEWGEGLIRSWNTAGWIDLPRRVGNKIARLVGAAPDELVVTDSTSINLYKVLSAALSIARADAPQRRVIVSERENFPTDLYMAQSLAAQHGMQLELVEQGQALGRLHDDVAVLLLTQVNYRSGALYDMAAVTAAAHAAGALTVWDLAHSAGAVPVDLNGAQADFAIGCGYKYLNGGPGAPAFVWVHARHVNRVEQPLSGWHGHAAPFVFTRDYQPAQGIARYLCGTSTLLSLAALDCGVDTLLAAEPMGGMQALRRKSVALSDLFIRLVHEQLSAYPLTFATPLDAARRGSQVSLTFDGDGYAVMQALIARRVIGDFRAGDKTRGDADLLRFGFTPLYLRYVDVFDAVQTLRDVLDSGVWREARFARKGAVT